MDVLESNKVGETQNVCKWKQGNYQLAENFQTSWSWEIIFKPFEHDKAMTKKL